MFLPRNPKTGSVYCRHQGRLALFHKSTTPVAYWRDYWNDAKRAQLSAHGQSGELYDYAEVLKKYAPKDLPVLEAGCGPAHMVAALVANGYDAIGVDFEPEVVKFVNQTYPSLRVTQGNICKLEAEDASIGCYFSGGVVEHFPEGPAAALREARRVLASNGVALIEVPYLNPARAKLLRRLAEIDTGRTDYAFHQYYFSVQEFEGLLQRSGLRLVEVLPSSVEAYLTREHPVVSRFWRSRLCRETLKHPFRQWFRNPPRWLGHHAAHTMLTVSLPF